MVQNINCQFNYVTYGRHFSQRSPDEAELAERNPGSSAWGLS